MIYILFTAIATLFTCAKGDEDYPFEELIFDVGSGMAVAACEKDESCSSMMSSITGVAIILALISFCICPPNEDDYHEYNANKAVKRGGAMSVGYIAGREIF